MDINTYGQLQETIRFVYKDYDVSLHTDLWKVQTITETSFSL